MQIQLASNFHQSSPPLCKSISILFFFKLLMLHNISVPTHVITQTLNISKCSSCHQQSRGKAKQ